MARNERSGSVVGALVPLGDYLRDHALVTGYGFEYSGNGVVCRVQNCRFANVAHRVSEGTVPCAPCPVFQLMQEALKRREARPSLRDHKILVDDGVTCVFYLDLESVPVESKNNGPQN